MSFFRFDESLSEHDFWSKTRKLKLYDIAYIKIEKWKNLGETIFHILTVFRTFDEKQNFDIGFHFRVRKSKIMLEKKLVLFEPGGCADSKCGAVTSIAFRTKKLKF